VKVLYCKYSAIIFNMTVIFDICYNDISSIPYLDSKSHCWLTKMPLGCDASDLFTKVSGQEVYGILWSEVIICAEIWTHKIERRDIIRGLEYVFVMHAG
jgi:hypothetical protein